MKKSAMFSLLALAVCAMPLTAMADTTVTDLGAAPGSAWITGTNLLKARGNDGYGAVKEDGTPVTESVYSSLDASKGYVIGQKYSQDDWNTSGLYDLEGNELIPCKYGDIRMESSKWAVAYTLKEADANNYDYTVLIGDGYLIIDTADVYYIADGKATLLTSLPRENFLDAGAHADYICIEDRSTNVTTMYDSTFAQVATDLNGTYDTGDIDVSEYETFYDNGQYGLKDKDGNVIMEPSFRSIYDFAGDYAEVSTGDKNGLIDKNGNLILPAEYDRIEHNYNAPASDPDEDSPYGAAGYFGITKDGKFGFADAAGNVTAEPTYSKDIFDIYGATAVYTDMENKKHLLAADGTDTALDETWEKIYPLQYSNGLLLEAYGDSIDGRYIIDWHGTPLFESPVYSAKLSGDGQTLLVEPEYNKPELYTVNYDLPEAAAAPAEAATEGAKQEAPAAVDASAAKGILDSVAALVDADATGNKAAISTLIDSAIAALGEDHADVAATLNSAKSLLTGDTVDAASLKALITSAASLLG